MSIQQQAALEFWAGMSAAFCLLFIIKAVGPWVKSRLDREMKWGEIK